MKQELKMGVTDCYKQFQKILIINWVFKLNF